MGTNNGIKSAQAFIRMAMNAELHDDTSFADSIQNELDWVADERDSSSMWETWGFWDSYRETLAAALA